MDITNKFSQAQLEAYRELIRPDSNWPLDLRNKFETKCMEQDCYQPNLDHEVITEYVQEKYA